MRLLISKTKKKEETNEKKREKGEKEEETERNLIKARQRRNHNGIEIPLETVPGAFLIAFRARLARSLAKRPPPARSAAELDREFLLRALGP